MELGDQLDFFYPQVENSSFFILGILFLFTLGARDKTGRAVLELYGDHWGWSSSVTSQELFMMLLYFYSINRYPLQRKDDSRFVRFNIFQLMLCLLLHFIGR